MSWFHSIISGGRALPQLRMSDGYVEIPGNYAYADSAVLYTYMLYSPQILYHNGKTFFIYPAPTTVLPFGQARMTLFDNQAGFDRAYTVGAINSATETHQYPAIAIDGDNAINVVQENVHTSPLDRYKSRAEDHGFFTKNSAFIGTSLAYPNLLKKDDGNFVVFSRGTNDFDIYITSSSSGFETWGAQRKISDAGASNLQRHYPTIPFGHGFTSIDGKFYLVFGRRVDDGILGGLSKWYRYYLVVTEDFNTFTNYGETFSHNVTTDGVLTETILATNFTYYEHADDKQGFIPIVGINPTTAKFYAIVGNATEDGYLFVYWNGSAWATREFSVPNINPVTDFNTTQHHPINYVTVLSETDIRVVVDILEGANVRQHWFQTTNEGVSWTDLGYVLEDVVEGDPIILLPSNLLQIPDNTNFGVFYLMSDPVNPGFSKILGRSAAWGSLQSIPGLTITPAASMSRASGNLFHYKAVDADITRVGNNVTALTDKFGIRNATGTSSPQWNGSDAIVTNGTSNFFTLGSVASLATVKEGTYMAVAKCATGVFSAVLSFTDNTGTELFELILCSTADGNVPAVMNRDSAGNLVKVVGQDRIDDGNYHLLTVVVDGVKKTEIYVDGKLQWYKHTASTSTQWNFIGDSQWNYATVNVATIGKRDNTTDAFFALTFKEVVAWSECLPIDELRQKMKKLCDDHSITYQNQFQVPV